MLFRQARWLARTVIVSVAGVSWIAAGDAAGRGAQAVEPAVHMAAGTRAVEAFTKRLERYVELHRRLEATLPKLPKDATPEQIDRNQRTLLALIQAERQGARRGDLFTPDMAAFVRQVIARAFGGPNGERLRSSIMDENVAELALAVNQRYPDAIPLTTMPPAILAGLPPLPEQMEFRFVVGRLVLLDTHAHLIVDFVPDALPPK